MNIGVMACKCFSYVSRNMEPHVALQHSLSARTTVVTVMQRYRMANIVFVGSHLFWDIAGSDVHMKLHDAS